MNMPLVWSFGSHMIVHTIGKVGNSEGVAVLTEICQGDVGRALTNHQMHRDETLEYNRPCRIAKSILERADNFGYACFARVGSDENVLDVFGFGRCVLLIQGMLASIAMCRVARFPKEYRELLGPLSWLRP